MQVEIYGLSFGLICIGIGLAIMGYFIGKGLQHFHTPSNDIDYYTFLKESDLAMFLHLNADELRALLHNLTDIPKIELNGMIYYPKRQLVEWIATKDFRAKM